MKSGYILKQVLKQLFPWPLFLLVLYPSIAGLLIDYSLIQPRDILVQLIWLSILTSLSYSSGKKAVYRIVVLLLAFIGFAEVLHWLILKGPLTVSSLFVISNTNFSEAREFLGLKWSFRLLLIIPYLVLLPLAFRMNPSINKEKIISRVVFGILLLSGLFILETIVHGRLVRKGIPPAARAFVSFVENRSLVLQAMKRKKFTPAMAVPLIQGKQTVVLVLGESLNRNHMSLYGAEKVTNPLLSARRDLLVFDNVISRNSNTLYSVLGMFSAEGIDRVSGPADKPDMIDLFHAAGFKTYWISNQSPVGIWDNLVTVLAKKTDETRFVNTGSNSSMEATTVTSFDSRIFEPFTMALQEEVPRKFIVLHLMGSHSSYGRRYPASFDVFRGKGRRNQTLAEYHNSILYNDFIVDSLLHIAETESLHTGSQSCLIYLSDHGENVYDTLDYAGHDYSRYLPDAIVEVPFLVWLSRSCISSDPARDSLLRQRLHTPFMTSDLVPAILDLSKVSSPQVNPSKSLFNQAWKPDSMRILEDGRNYNQKKFPVNPNASGH